MAHKSQEMTVPKIREHKPLINTRSRAGQSAFQMTRSRIAEYERSRDSTPDSAQTPRGYEATAEYDPPVERTRLLERVVRAALHKALARHHRAHKEAHAESARKKVEKGLLEDAQFHLDESLYHHNREGEELNQERRWREKYSDLLGHFGDSVTSRRLLADAEDSVDKVYGKGIHMDAARALSEIAHNGPGE